jgi:hypothetical protein
VSATNVQAQRKPSPRPPEVLDPWHAAVVDAACSSDAARVAAGEPTFLRLAIPHEMCEPGQCRTWPTMVIVTAIADGIRTRQPFAASEAAA